MSQHDPREPDLNTATDGTEGIAIIGMAGRFPGAPDIATFWANILAGKDTVTRFSPEQLEVLDRSKTAQPDYVRARGVLEDAAMFDADFFGIPPREADVLDPQHRLLLEACHNALEDAGYVPQSYPGEIGLFAGCSLNTYLLANLAHDRAFLDRLTADYQVGDFQVALGNDKDFLTTRIAYKLDLRGPCVSVQAACATSLVAVCQAAQALLNYQCDMALAGGVSVTFPQHRGHIHQEGSLASKDGVCRPFDAQASGTVFGHGVGAVLLKRLEDAQRDGDHIYAVIRGFAVNNDGAGKAGYMAPSVEGQARVIEAAQAMAGWSPDTITCIEAHGTGTPLGDPIEVAALTRAFRKGTDRKGYCTLGTAKANVGHLDSAAGVTGLIKVALSIQHATHPGLANFHTSNLDLALSDSPFLIATRSQPWAAEGQRRAGVSAFGVGGVNAHVVLEETPATQQQQAAPQMEVLCLSARTLSALQQAKANLANYLEKNPDLPLADIAFTLSIGRRTFAHRFAIAASTAQEAAAALRSERPSSSGLENSPARTLAQQWMRGEEVEWRAAFAGRSVRRVSLPTYPFERSLYWVAPPSQTTEASTTTASQDLSTSASNTSAESSREQKLQDKIIAVLAELSGIALGPQDAQVEFLELGFDSLFLTQATGTLSKTFGTKLTFRQLMEDHSSIAALAEHLDAVLPAETFAELPAPIAATTPTLPVAPASAHTNVQRMLSEQLAALQQMFTAQVSALQAVAAGSPTQIPSPPPVQPANTAEVKHGSFRPLQPSAKHELSPSQTKYIEDITRRYEAKTPGSKRLTAQARPHLADPRAVAGFRPQWKEMVYPLITDRAKGSRLWDVDGNEYIDIVNGYGCILFGHSPDFVVKAAHEQLERGVAIGPQSALAGEVASLICELTGNQRVTFCNTGSEAVMAAIRVARTVTGRDRIVYFTGDYHGTFDEVLIRNTPRGSAPVAPGIPIENVKNVTVLEYGAASSLAWIRDHAEEIAAVLIEPVQTRNPCLQPIEFIREVRAITAQTGSAVILDEVVTGFRLAPGGVQQQFGIRADMCTYGKVIGGGHPIGVLSGKAQFLDALDGGAWQYGDTSAPEVGVTFFAGTFVRHPLALAAARAVLTHLKQQGPELQRVLNEKTETLAQRLDSFMAERGVPCRIHSFASWFYFVFPHESRFSGLFYYSMRLKGIHIQEGYPCFLTTAHSEADIHAIEQAFRDTTIELQAADILPSHPHCLSFRPEREARSGETPVFHEGKPRRDEPESQATTIPSSVPMTAAQREIFFAAALSDEANCAFNESVIVRLHGGPVRREALTHALQTIIQRHDALRSAVTTDGETLEIAPASSVQIEVVDLQDQPHEEQEQAISSRIAQEARRPFDLHCGPLLRAICFWLAPDEAALLVVAHHIAFDGWSANQFLEEVGLIYSKGDTAFAALTPLLPFSSFAAREHQREASGYFAGNERYWVETFEGLTPRLDLPTDRPRPAIKSYRGGTVEGHLSAEQRDNLKKLSGKNGCTLYTTLLSGFQLLLHRVTGQNEVVVGISAAGQSLDENASLVGHCVNFLPMLSRLGDHETVQQHLHATRTALLDAYDHQEFTYGTLLSKLKLERDPGRLPVIEVQFNLERVGDNVRFEGLTTRIRANAKHFVNTDLFLNVVETKQGLDILCDYNTELFNPETVQRWLANWSMLLASAAAEPGTEVSSLNMLPSEEREFVLNRWNQTATDFGEFESVPATFMRIAALHPARTAVRCGARQWTYAELAEYTRLLAGRMIHEGLRPGDLVGICIERSPEMVGAVLAVLLAGAAYVPLDPRHPRERMSMIVADAGITMLLAGRDPSVETSAKILRVNGPQANTQPNAGKADTAAITPHGLAYVIYTSGSTGTPKGVAVQHGALVNLLRSMQRTPGLHESDVFLAVTTLAFDIATLELLNPLLVGAQLVMATEEQVQDGHQLLQLISQAKVTALQATPGAWRLLLDAGWTGADPLKVMCGGEALPRDLAVHLTGRSSDVWNMYGPTETTIWSSATRIHPGTGPITVGPPIANTQFYLLDSHQQPVPVGSIGELYIGGEGLARDYWKRPELTAQRFLANPFHAGRMYSTGDLGRWRGNGSLELLGRSDFQVKVRGYRIELGDIEAALARHSDVSEAAVVQHHSTVEPARTQLVAFVATSVKNRLDSPEALASELGEAIASSLPEYMMPAAIHIVAELPRNTSGKIDRRALERISAELGANSFAQQKELRLPETPEEKQLAAIWGEVLGLQEVGITDSIFELGADSLLIFRIAARAHREGLPLTAALIFQHRTIHAICRALQARKASSSNDAERTRISIPVAAREKYRRREVQIDG